MVARRELDTKLFLLHLNRLPRRQRADGCDSLVFPFINFFSPVYDVFSEPTLSASKENIDDAVFVSPVTKSMNAKTRMQMEFAVLEFAVTPKRSNRYCLRRLI